MSKAYSTSQGGLINPIQLHLEPRGTENEYGGLAHLLDERACTQECVCLVSK